MIKRVDKRLQAVQCLTGNKIKIIACITMLIVHFSKIFLESIMNDKLFPLYLAGGMSTEQFYGIDAFQKNILNGIGTIAFPLFCLLLSEGFFYTKNRKRYIGGMLAFALISEVPFDIGFFSRYSIAEGTFPFYLQYWICWSVTCRSSFFTSSIRREICCRSIRLIGRKNSTREVIPGAI